MLLLLSVLIVVNLTLKFAARRADGFSGLWLVQVTKWGSNAEAGVKFCAVFFLVV